MAFSKDKAHERAERYASKGQHDRAAREYQSIVDYDPKDLRAWLMLADCLARAGDRNGAINRYMQIAEFYAAQKALPKALAVYRQVLNLDPARLDVHLKTAALNFELGKTHDALAAYEQVAQVQMQAGRIGEAIETYRTIADADPPAVAKRLRVAELLSREGRVDDAVEQFRAAGDVLLQTNRLSDYVRVAERLLYHRPEDRPTTRQLARVYLRLGDARRALMKLNVLLQSDQGDSEGLELLGETFTAMGKADKAGSVMLELARRLVDQGDSVSARRILEKALEWDPHHPELTRLQGRLSSPSGFEQDAFDGDERDALEVDEADVLEVDEQSGADSVEVQLSGGPALESQDGPPPSPAAEGTVRSNLADVLASAGRPAAVESEPNEDLDKILFEARVYVKYRLFDHALEHIQALLDVKPRHIGALSLRASALAELERYPEAAEAHVEVARLVAEQNTTLALEHLEAALECEPGWADAKSLREVLRDGGRVPTPVRSGGTVMVPRQETPPPAVPDELGEGDSDAVDLVDGGELDDFDVEVAVFDDDEQTGKRSTDFPVEDRFGLGDGETHPTAASSSSTSRTLGAEGSRPVARPGSSGFGREVSDEADYGEDDELGTGDPEAGGTLAGFQAVDFEDFEVDPETFTEVPIDRLASAIAQGKGGTSWPDISDEVAEVRFFLAQGLEDDAAVALGDLRRRYTEQHPSLAEFGASPSNRPALSSPRAPSSPAPSKAPPAVAAAQSRSAGPTATGPKSVPTPANLPKAVPAPTSGAPHGSTRAPAATKPTKPQTEARSGPLSSAEDDEADAYLLSIFNDDGTNARRRNVEVKSRNVEVKAREVDVAGADPRTHFDLALAYREMGLVNEAIREFETAARDRSWCSRSLIMAAAVRSEGGNTQGALADLTRAVATATTEDERCEASYELAMLYEKLGDTRAAVRQLQSVAEGYRDRDQRLEALRG